MTLIANTPEHERAAERLRQAGGIRDAFEALGLGWTLDDLGDYMRPAVGDESGRYAGALAAFTIVIVEKLRPPVDGDAFYLCLNCGVITHQDLWTMWQPDGDHEFGEAEYRPHGLREHDSDALLKCPRCGEMHGDGYVGAGIEEGTLAICDGERTRMLTEEGTAEMWAEALAK